jgi:hypothetical protein
MTKKRKRDAREEVAFAEANDKLNGLLMEANAAARSGALVLLIVKTEFDADALKALAVKGVDIRSRRVPADVRHYDVILTASGFVKGSNWREKWAEKLAPGRRREVVRDEIKLVSPIPYGVRGDALDAFFYDLMRDHLTPGVLEKLVREAEKRPQEMYTFSNEHLALYAKELRARLDRASVL